ncbi:hypothetical protein B0H13DRAFT_2339696 [Mycena leptocephala]|nr:hypothetical protein B0H13DRAFT_2339696 [Mycena leptocephala]
MIDHPKNLTDDTQDAWSNFVKAHPHFKPFATCGWPHFTTVDAIVPSRALGQYVFSPGTADPTIAPSQPSQEPSQPSQGDDDDEDGSQPFSDWSQSNFGESQSPDPTNSVPASQSTASRAPKVHAGVKQQGQSKGMHHRNQKLKRKAFLRERNSEVWALERTIIPPESSGPFEADDPAPRAVSEAWLDVVCPRRERRYINTRDVKPAINQAPGIKVLNHWQARRGCSATRPTDRIYLSSHWRFHSPLCLHDP